MSHNRLSALFLILMGGPAPAPAPARFSHNRLSALFLILILYLTKIPQDQWGHNRLSALFLILMKRRRPISSERSWRSQSPFGSLPHSDPGQKDRKET